MEMKHVVRYTNTIFPLCVHFSNYLQRTCRNVSRYYSEICL